jgi:hypothetical protein
VIYSWTETTDGVAVAKSVNMDDATIDALNAAGLAAYTRLPAASLDAALGTYLAALVRADPAVVGALLTRDAQVLGRAYDAQEVEVRDVASATDPAIKTADGGRLSLDADGFVYLDGQRLQVGTVKVAVARLRVIGKSIYGLGKTDGTWWQYTGTGATGWVKVDATRIDPSLFT